MYVIYILRYIHLSTYAYIISYVLFLQTIYMYTRTTAVCAYTTQCNCIQMRMQNMVTYKILSIRKYISIYIYNIYVYIIEIILRMCVHIHNIYYIQKHNSSIYIYIHSFYLYIFIRIIFMVIYGTQLVAYAWKSLVILCDEKQTNKQTKNNSKRKKIRMNVLFR